ncbi:putative lipoprotein [Streptococcus equinus]|nr:putative lipoprotein [Streptococcus equinus]
MTIQKPVIDENIDLKEGYPEEEYSKFEGKKHLLLQR